MTAVRKVFGERVISRDFLATSLTRLDATRFLPWGKIEGTIMLTILVQSMILNIISDKSLPISDVRNYTMSSAACVGVSSSVSNKMAHISSNCDD